MAQNRTPCETLPALPVINLLIERDRSPRHGQGYLSIRRLDLRATFPDGTESEPFAYDVVQRAALDAVVVVAHYREGGLRRVLLRSAIRPPVALRPREVWPVPERPTLGGLWEVVAGLVEPGERSEQGLRACAARELYEELGATVTPEQVLPLGPSTFPCPGVMGERHFYFHVEVDPAALTQPAEDGSVLERQAAIVAISLDDALELVRRGEIEDAKTEIALRRLLEI